MHYHVCLLFLQKGTIYVTSCTFLNDKALPNRGLVLKEKICSKRSKFFALIVRPPVNIEVEMKMPGLLSLIVYPFTFTDLCSYG